MGTHSHLHFQFPFLSTSFSHEPEVHTGANICGLSVHIDPELYTHFHSRLHPGETMEKVHGCRLARHFDKLTNMFRTEMLSVVQIASEMLEHPMNNSHGISLALRLNELNVGELH